MIREATSADLSAIQDIAKAAYSPFVAGIGRKPAPMIADFATQIEEGIVEVSADEVRVQGFCVSYPEGTVWHVENIAVSPSAQGSGIGRALLESAEQQAKSWGFETVELYTNVGDDGRARAVSSAWICRTVSTRARWVSACVLSEEPEVMSSKIVNLRQARKRKAREDKSRDGDANAAVHGLKTSETDLAKARAAKAARDLDGHKRD